MVCLSAGAAPDGTQEGKCRTRSEQWSPTLAAHFRNAVIIKPHPRATESESLKRRVGLGLGAGRGG